MPFIRQIAIFFLLVAALLGLALWLWATSGGVNSWQTWLFRAGHQVVRIVDEEYGPREVRFVLRPGEDVAAAVRDCARSFDKDLMSEGMYVHCVAYASAAEAERVQPDGPWCERGRAVQQPYSSGARAEVFLNPGQGCAASPNFLPEYARPTAADQRPTFFKEIS